MTRAAIKKYTSLVAACVLTVLIGDLLGFIRIDLIGNRLNKIEKIALAITSHKSLSGKVEAFTENAGISYAVYCDKDLSAVPGASDLRQNADRAIQKVFQSRGASAGSIFACRIATSLSSAEWMKTPGRVLPANVVLQSVGMVASDDVVIDTTRGSFRGNPRFAGYISATAIIIILIACVTFIRSWKDDIRAALTAIVSSPQYVLLPTLVSVVAASVTGFTKQRIFDIARSDTLIESLMYAPLVEEIVYRFFLFEIVKRYSNALFSAVVVSLGFAYAHHGDVGAFFGYFVFAVAQQFLYVNSKSVSLCVASHALCNLVVLLGRGAL